MKPVTLTLSHNYKEMREKNRKQAEGKTTLLGVGWLFPHCRWTGSPSSMMAARAVAVAITAAVRVARAIIITVTTIAPRSNQPALGWRH